MSKKVAIIDLGSNSARLALMQIAEDGSYQLLDEIQEVVRIAEKTGPEKMIQPSAIERAVQAVKTFRKFCDANKVAEIYSVATAAIRNAHNGQAVLETIHQETGILFRVLSGEEEARYEYLGVVNNLSFDNALIVDIGGGSTELILCQNRKMVRCTSLSFGAVTITDNFIANPVINPDEIKKLNTFLYAQYANVSWLKEAQGLEVIGVGGTMRNLGRIDRKKLKYSFDILRNYILPSARAVAIYFKLQNTSLAERKTIPGISKGRVDIIVGGVAIAATLLNHTKAPNIRVSGSGLREGLFYENLFKDQAVPIVDDVVEHSIQNLINGYQVRKTHVEHVAKLSLFLFDQLCSCYGYGAAERKLLRIAALLHNLGAMICYYDYHRHTMYILLNARINGLTHREQILIAFITACHSKVCLKSQFKQYADILLPNDENIVRRLGSLLKMGKKFNKHGAGMIEDVICAMKKGAIKIS